MSMRQLITWVAGGTVPALVLALSGPLPADRPAAPSADELTEPLVIGHRGASGYRPEHTLGSYRLAIQLGADYIEADLVTTKDGTLVARHENNIAGTTDVEEHPEFADRRTTNTIDGETITGWFTEDFTVAELKTLRATERLPQLRPHNTLYHGRYTIPTLQEVIDLAKRHSERRDRPVGLYLETKHPTYFDSVGLSLEEPLDRALERNDLDGEDEPVFVQSFEVGNLQQLNTLVEVPLVQLIAGSGAPYDLASSGDPRTYDDLSTTGGLRQIARYADGIGPDKDRIVPRDSSGNLQQPTELVDRAHHEGLVVHPYTFRNENTFLPAQFREGGNSAAFGDAFAEYALFYDLGVDGLFTDHPDTAAIARRDVSRRRSPTP
jgi:glycerophosphoryl diester phosphodiesterase